VVEKYVNKLLKNAGQRDVSHVVIFRLHAIRGVAERKEHRKQKEGVIAKA
jgi:hypothetical protein